MRLTSSSLEEHCPNPKSNTHATIHSIATKKTREFIDNEI